MAYDVFLSYARDDDVAYLEELYGVLDGAGLRVWWDQSSMPSRALTFHHEIRTAIDESERVLVVLGPDAASSEYVRSEWQYALSLGKAVTAVVRLGGMDQLPPELKNLHAVDGRKEVPKAGVFATLIRLLREPVPSLAPPIGVPALPPHFQPRADALTAVADVLLIDRRRPDEVSDGPRCLVLHGMSGSGKSTIAAAFARMVETRRAFPDGVVWLRCDAFPDTDAAVRSVVRVLRPGAQLADDPLELAHSLRDTLAGRSVLLVLDNARSVEDVEPFLSALGVSCRILVTSLDGGIATVLGAPERRVDVLTAQQSAALLADWTGEAAGPEAAAVIEECGGLPFALAIVGAMAADGQAWSEILALLRERDLDLIARRFPGYPHPHLLRALDAGIEALRRTEPQAAELYLDFAVFREGAIIPEDAVLRFWSRRAGVEPRRARTVLPILERRTLIHVETVAGRRRIRLHKLHEDYLRLVAPDPAALHVELITAYGEAAQDGWASGPDDGYFFENLAFHLAFAGRREALFGLVDERWIETQLGRSGTHQAAVADLEVALHRAAEEPVAVAAFARCCLLQSILRASSFVATPTMIELLAVAGEVDRALAWASLQPDGHPRFEALLLIAGVLVDAGDSSRARMVLETALRIVPHLGETLDEGFAPELAQLAAVHVLVGFPEPEQWDATTAERVALARIPLDAVLELVPVLARADALDLLNQVQHPFWGFYHYLLPRVAAERLALDGRTELARAVLEALRHPDVTAQGLADVDHAASYRDAVAWAALGEHDRAVRMIDEIPNPQYRSVGYHRIARHASAAGRFDLALQLIDGITDWIEGEAALEEVASAFRTRPDERVAEDLTQRLVGADKRTRAALVQAAAGRIESALAEADALGHDIERARLRLAIAATLRDTGRRDAAGQIVDALVDEVRLGAGPQWIVAPFTASVPEVQRAATLDLITMLASLDRWRVCAASLQAIPIPQRWSIAIQLAPALAAAGCMRRVLDLADEIEEPGFRALVFANALLRMGDAVRDPEAEREVVERLLDQHERLPEEQRAALPLGRLLLVVRTIDPPDLTLRIAEALQDTEAREAVRAEAAVRSARAGDLTLARRIAASFKPTLRPVPCRADLARLLCVAAGGLGRSGREADAAGTVEQCVAMLEDAGTDADALAVGRDLAIELVSYEDFERAATLAHGLGGADPLEILIEIAKPQQGATQEGFRIEPAQATRVTALALAQAGALLGVAAGLARVGRAPDAVPLAQRAQTLGSIALQLGAQDEGRLIVIESLILSGDIPSAFELLTGDVATILPAAKALAAAGRVDDALAILDHTLAELREDPLGFRPGGGQRIITTEQFWSSERATHLATTDVLLTLAELALDAGLGPLAAARADEAVKHTTHAPAAERIRAFTSVAHIRSRLGDAREADRLIAGAEHALQRDPAALDDRPNPRLEIARAWANVGRADRARDLWLSEAARARFAAPSEVAAALAAGLACLAHGRAADELRDMAGMAAEVNGLGLVA